MKYEKNPLKIGGGLKNMLLKIYIIDDKSRIIASTKLRIAKNPHFFLNTILQR